MSEHKVIFALPKGRILKEVQPVLEACDIVPEPDFFDEKSRKLQFKTNHAALEIIRVRAFDVATFVAHGGAQLGIVGSDVLAEFPYQDLYAPLDLNIGHCRLSVAGPDRAKAAQTGWPSHLKVATKYPNVTRTYFARAGVQAECIKLNGAMEIAPRLDLAPYIVDLVSTGATLKANQLIEINTIQNVSSRLIVNRIFAKTHNEISNRWINAFLQAVDIEQNDL